MRLLLPLISIFVSGCQTRQAAVNPAPLPAAEIPTGPDARIASVIGHYTLGAYVDTDNALIRHEAHAIQRIETPPRWDLRTVPEERPAAPTPTFSGPTLPTEKAPPAAAEPSTPPPPTNASTSIAAPSLPLPPVEARRDAEPVAALTPNADGFVDLTLLASAPDSEINPFAVRSVRTDATREISFVLGGVVHGAVPCALINGSPVQAGETVDSLTLVSLEADAALFRRDDRLIRIPVAAKPVRVRVAL
jgi:hypothetical protein